MNLCEWMILYVKHKDAFAKQLVGHKEEQEKVTFSFKDYELVGYALEKLELAKIAPRTLIVTLQKKENIRTLIDEWTEFSKHPGLTVLFVNPSRHEKWIIKPHLHNKIAEGNIEQGIHSMAESVTFV